MKREIAIRAGRLLCMAVLGGVFALRAHGAVFNWNGAGANDNWTTAGNWAEGTPTNDGSADIQFGGSTRPTPNLDVDYSIHSLTFVASAANFTLASATNQTLTIGAGGITNSS